MDNKNKKDVIHDLMPPFFKTRQNPNWKSVIDTIGQSDQDTADLVEEVRKQFFVKTASRPYIDRLGANVLVSRPKFIGMDDSDFKQYIPVLSYQPKQVKLVIDQLLDLFFFKESTTAFFKSGAVEPYFLKDGWELDYSIDALNSEHIAFSASDFANIASATAEEIVSAINRQAQNSFAIVYNDSIAKTNSVRLFTKTVGAKGSVQMLGGRADIALQFQGYNAIAGNQASTIWSIDVSGDTVTFAYAGGGAPLFSGVQVGDIVIIDIPGYEGSYPVTNIDIVGQSFTFTNPFAAIGTFDHGAFPNTYVRFFTPDKTVIWTKNLRAIAWEVQPGEIVIEMPASPPIVKRKLAGSAHINGLVSVVSTTPSQQSLTLQDATDWPVAGGHFVLQPLNEIKTHIKTQVDDEITTKNFNSRFQRSEQYYEYTGKSGNTLTGITPDLPEVAGVYENTIVTATRNASNVVTVITATAHGFQAGENVGINDTVPTVDLNPAINLSDPLDGAFEILTVPTPTSFTYRSFGDEGQATGGRASVERVQISDGGSLAYLTSARLNTRLNGPFMWDLKAPYVLSSLTTTLTSPIIAGDAMRSIDVAGPNSIPSEDGYLIFDFGTEREEGPVRYLYKPNDTIISIDPAYIFQNNHDVNSAVTMIRRRGAHVMSGLASEYPLYITDPSIARPVLQDLITKVKSVGIFLNFLIRYPTQYYATLNVYEPGTPLE